jgi:hypothetical protein
MPHNIHRPAFLFRRAMKGSAGANIPFGPSLLGLASLSRKREEVRSLRDWEPLLRRNELSTELSRNSERRLHSLAQCGLTMYRLLIGILAATEFLFMAILLFRFLA